MLIHLDYDFLNRKWYTGNYPVSLTISGVIENDILTKIDKITLEPIFDSNTAEDVSNTGVDVEIQESNSKCTLVDFVASLTEEEKEKLKNYLNELEKGDLK